MQENIFKPLGMTSSIIPAVAEEGYDGRVLKTATIDELFMPQLQEHSSY
jgi:CubicO group peptidase (beta-lactamase class C family)